MPRNRRIRSPACSRIPNVGSEIPGKESGSLPHWPDERFDVVWVFDANAKGAYSLKQVPAMLLAGDVAREIK